MCPGETATMAFSMRDGVVFWTRALHQIIPHPLTHALGRPVHAYRAHTFTHREKLEEEQTQEIGTMEKEQPRRHPQ